MKSPLGIIISFALSLRGGISTRPGFPTPQMSTTITSLFQILPAYKTYPRNMPGNICLPNWWILDWSFEEIGWYSTNEPDGKSGSRLETRELVEKILLILQENQGDFLLELVAAVSRWMFSGPDLLQGFWFVHLRLEKWILLFGEISPLSHWVLSSRFLMRPSFPAPQRLQPLCHPSKFHPRTKRIRGTIKVRLSFQIDGFLTGLSQK